MDNSPSTNPNHPPAQDETINHQRALWAAVIFTVFALSSLGLLVYVVAVTPAWQVYVITAITAMATAVDVASLVAIRRGRAELGLKMLYWSTMLSIIPNAFFAAGAGAIMIAMALLLGYINVFYLQPRAWRRRYQYGPLVIGLLIAAIEFWNPPFRFSFFTTPFFGPSSLAFLTVSITALILFGARREIASSLRLKIVVWTGLIVVVLSSALVAYSVVNGRRAAIESAQAGALAIAESQARQIQTDTEIPLSMARSLAQALIAVKDPAADIQLSRDQVNAMLRQVLIENPSFLGTYTLWEPNAFDRLDASYKNTPVHDASGRFIPYWVRGDDGSISVIALEQYETPGIGDWYVLPRQTRHEMTFAPLIYPINGVDTVMASFVVPVLYNDQFYGIVGVDAPIAFVQEIVDSVNLYDGSADAVLMTTSGTLIGVRNRPDLVNQPASEIYPDLAELQQRLEAGQAFISPSPDGMTLRVFAPVELGQSGSHWIFGLTIPYSNITASATTAAAQESILGVGLLLLSILLLWFFTGQIASPIRALTNAADAVTGGDLNASASVQTADEIGLLAGAFNTMTSRLRGTLATLEERVASRTRNLELAAEVGRAVSQVRVLDVMLKDACELILKEFDLYYVQVYLTDPGGSNLKLEAGTGSVGIELLGRSHSLPINTGSINGRAVVEKRSVVISDTAQSATFRPNPLLPETRSEMAVPLIVADKVVGVLDMQSNAPGVLTGETLPAFEALAGQLAVAVQNANLLAETEQARAQMEAQARRLVREGWSEHLDAIHKPEQLGYVFAKNVVTPLSDAEETQSPGEGRAVTAPIAVTGEALGSLVVEIEDESRAGQINELVGIVARQVAQQIENLRLLESAERYRQEAEEASRRLTHEGWKSYRVSPGGTPKYFYDLNEVRSWKDGESLAAATRLPLKVRDEVVGQFAVQGLDAGDTEALELANAVAERLGAHIESLRQFDETQSALAQSEKLFEASRRLTQAADLQELTAAAVAAINIPVVNRTIMATFTHDSEGQAEGLDVIANWWNGSGMQATAIGTHYTAEVVRMIPMFVSPIPLFFDDAFNDERVDPATMNLVKRLNLRTVAVLPLHVGASQVGVLMLEGEEPHNFTEEEKRLFIALGPQIATVLENRRQFERAQKQAEREAMLNVINQKIQGATSVESVLQIAARELGHALGAPMTIAQLSLKDTSA